MSLAPASSAWAGEASVRVKVEIEETDGQQHSVWVKQEPEWTGDGDVKQEGGLQDIYMGHKVDTDFVQGPGGVQVKEEREETDGQHHGIRIKEEPEWTDEHLEIERDVKVEVEVMLDTEQPQQFDSSFMQPTCGGADDSRVGHEENSLPYLETPVGCGDWKPGGKQVISGGARLGRNLVKDGQSLEKAPYNCDVCMKPYTRKGELDKHYRMHTGVKPYSCHVCTKQFTRNGDLIKHSRTHTGEKPYSCKVCMKQFTRNGDLIIHSRTHTGEKPYSCKVCTKQFTRKSVLVQHGLTHTGEKPYSCKVCNRQFTQRSNLIIHSRIHTGEKPYSCDVCQKLFAHKNGLAVHRQIHKVKPYICDVCKENFTERSNLVAHLQTHSEKPCS